MNDLLVLSVCTDESPELTNFENSLKQNGYSYEILGKGEKWGGWDYRTKKYLSKLKTLDPELIVVLCDATDMLFVQPKDVLLQKFLNGYDDKVIIGAESNCCTGKYTGDLVLLNTFNTNIERYRFPNGGWVIGRVKNLIFVLNKIKKEKDDQAGYLDLLIEKSDILVLDSENYFVSNILPKGSNFVYKKIIDIMDNTCDYDFIKIDKENNYYNELTNNYPVAIHFPASNTDDYNKIGKNVIKNFLPIENIKKSKFNSYRICHFMKNILTYIAIILIIIFLITLILKYIFK